MRGVRVAVCLMLLAASLPSAAQPRKPATFFADGTRNPVLLRAIGRAAVNRIDFNRRFSSAIVSCGMACTSFWFVDRTSGAVVAAPGRPAAGEAIWNVVSTPAGDTVRVIYGPADGSSARCRAQSFRLNGTAFKVLGPATASACP